MLENRSAQNDRHVMRSSDFVSTSASSETMRYAITLNDVERYFTTLPVFLDTSQRRVCANSRCAHRAYINSSQFGIATQNVATVVDRCARDRRAQRRSMQQIHRQNARGASKFRILLGAKNAPRTGKQSAAEIISSMCRVCRTD